MLREKISPPPPYLGLVSADRKSLDEFQRSRKDFQTLVVFPLIKGPD
jgi:hypothetical protein